MDFNKLADPEIVQKTADALSNKGYIITDVKSGKDALAKLKEIIPQGSSVMNGSSVTLEQIGYMDYLASGKHNWLDLQAKVTAQDDKEKRIKLRRESVLSEYYLGSVHALTQDGEFIIASNTGSQLPHIVYTSANLIFVISTKKIVKDLDQGMRRLKEHVFPLEDKNLMEKYKVHSNLSKIVIFRDEAKSSTRKIYIILVKQDLGF